MRDDRDRLLDVLEAIERIDKHAVRGRQAFQADELIQTWMIHHLQIIGEACRSVSDDLKLRFPQVPWAKITGMRNILVHQYFGIDTQAVWAAVADDLPALGKHIEQMLAQMSDESE
ncbi:MAG: HepT-like ribonuclease domain-containing protein [Phycisphaerae bacterium]